MRTTTCLYFGRWAGSYRADNEPQGAELLGVTATALRVSEVPAGGSAQAGRPARMPSRRRETSPGLDCTTITSPTSENGDAGEALQTGLTARTTSRRESSRQPRRESSRQPRQEPKRRPHTGAQIAVP